MKIFSVVSSLGDMEALQGDPNSLEEYCQVNKNLNPSKCLVITGSIENVWQ